MRIGARKRRFLAILGGILIPFLAVLWIERASIRSYLEIRRLRRQLDSGDAGTQQQALERLFYMGLEWKDAPVLLKALKSASPDVRRKAIILLQTIHGIQPTFGWDGVPLYRGLPKPNQAAFYAPLSEFSPPLSLPSLPETRQAVIPAMEDPDPFIRFDAAMFLLSTDPESRPSVLKVLADGMKSDDPILRAQAVRGFGSDPGGAKAHEETFRKSLRDPAPSVRIEAVGALAATLGRQAFPEIASAILDPDEDVRRQAYAALDCHRECLGLVLMEFAQALRHPDINVRKDAVQSNELREIAKRFDLRGHPIVPTLEKVCEDPDPGVQEMALRAWNDVQESQRKRASQEAKRSP